MEISALELLQQKQATKVGRIRGKALYDGSAEEPVVTITLPLSEIAKARAGTGARRGLGFALGPVEFTLPDGSVFQLYAAWVSLTAR